MVRLECRVGGDRDDELWEPIAVQVSERRAVIRVPRRIEHLVQAHRKVRARLQKLSAPGIQQRVRSDLLEVADEDVQDAATTEIANGCGMGVVGELWEVGRRVLPPALRTRQIEPVLISGEWSRVVARVREKHVRPAISVEVGEDQRARVVRLESVHRKERRGGDRKASVAVSQQHASRLQGAAAWPPQWSRGPARRGPGCHRR